MPLVVGPSIYIDDGMPQPGGLRPLPVDVLIYIPPVVTGQLSYIVTFKFNQSITDFVLADDLESTNVSLSNLQGQGDTWTVNATLPTNSNGTATIRVKANSVTGNQNQAGPENPVSSQFAYDTRTTTVTNPPASCVRQFDFSDPTFPYVAPRVTGETGGSFESVMEARVIGNSIFAVVQIGRYVTAVETPDDRDREPVFTTKAITGEIQAAAVLLRCDLATCTWTTLKRYQNMTVAARSLKRISNTKLRFFEGSHYAYYNEGEFNQLSNPNTENAIIVGTDVERINTAFSTGLVGGSFENQWKPGTVMGNAVIQIRIDRNTADFQSIRRALRTGRILIIDRIRFAITTVTESGTGRNGIFTMRYTRIDHDVFPAVGADSRIRVSLAGNERVFSRNRLRNLDEDDNWKAQIGHLYDVNVTTNAITDLGVNWISADIEDNPNRDKKRPYYEIVSDADERVPIDRYYGIHGGTASPLIYDGEKTHLITGYGKLDEINDNDSEASRLANWQWVQHHDKLNQRVVKLDTNQKTVLEVMEQIATITGSIIYFDGDKFILKSRAQTSVDHTISLTQQTLVQPISSINIQTDLEQVYNRIRIQYGNGKEYSEPDMASIARYGDRPLSVMTELDESQLPWIKWLHDLLLTQLKTLREFVTLRLAASIYLQLGDIVTLTCSERDALNRNAQVIDIRHGFERQDRGKPLVLNTTASFVTI